MGMLVYPGMAETSVAALGGVERFGRDPVNVGVFLYDHLANAFTVVDYKRSVGKIDYDDSDFSAIVCIDSAGSVYERNAVFQCQT